MADKKKITPPKVEKKVTKKVEKIDPVTRAENAQVAKQKFQEDKRNEYLTAREEIRQRENAKLEKKG